MQIKSDQKIFVAGSNGMVGKSICREILIKYPNIELLTPNRKELNLTNFEDVNLWFKKNKPSIVIISAARVGGIFANSKKPYDFILENLKIQNNIIELSWKYNVKRLLFLGSSCIYPKFSKQPIKEDSLLQGELEPTNEFYALAKIAGIKLCESLRKQHSFDSICLMPCNLYGIGDNYHKDDSHVIPALIRKISEAKEKNLKEITCWGSGNPLREFLYVDDLANACIYVLNNWYPSENLSKEKNIDNLPWLNVGSNEEISIKDLALRISKIVGFNGKIYWDESKPDGTPRKKLDTTRLNKLGWFPKMNLDHGLELTYEDYKNSLINNTLRK